jgi:hypothetical protein
MRSHLLLALCVMALTAVSCGKKAPPFLTVPVSPGGLGVEEVLVEGNSVLVSFRVPRERISLGREEEPWVLARMLRGESAEAGEVFEERAAMVEENGFPFGERLVIADDRVEAGKIYLYRIELRKEKAKEWVATELLTVETHPAPGAPRDFHVDGREAGVVLSWSPPEDAGTNLEYQVMRREAGGVTERLGPGPLTGTTFSDTRIRQEREYCYSVVPYRRDGSVVMEGTATDELCARAQDRTPPEAPAGLLAVPASEGVSLTWLPATAPDVRGYNIYRAEKNRAFTRLNAEPVDAARYRDTTAGPGVEYRYRVTAVDSSQSGNESPFSDTVTVPSRR